MYLPQFKGAGRKAQKQAVQFGGLNYTQAYQDGELAQASGVSSRMWPCLTTRAGRAAVGQTHQTEDLYAWGELVAVDGTSLLYGGQVVGTVEPGRKQFAVVGTKLCIFPDKKYLDLTTQEMGDLQATVVNNTGLEATFTKNSVTLEQDDMLSEIKNSNLILIPTETWLRSLRYQRASGQSYYVQVFAQLDWDSEKGEWAQTIDDAEEIWLPAAKQRGLIGKKVWLRDTGISGGYALNFKKMDDLAYINAQNRVEWERTVEADYGDYNTRGLYGVILEVTERNQSKDYDGCYTAKDIALTVGVHDASVFNPSLEGIFFPGDRVSISGCTAQEGNNRTALQVESVEGTTVTFVLSDHSHFAPGAETGAVKLCRDVPDLDFICESGGRLWGVSNQDGHIYASRGGDPFNFYAYIEASGATTDCSWSIPVGTDGAWTGCVAYGSNVLCWKENTLHKVLGTHAANYEVFSYQIAGVQAGCEKSLQIVNEVLYYKGRDGVYAYTGGSPRRISGKLGLVDYGRAVAGQDGRNYIISMERADTGAWETLSYGIETGLWMAENQQEVAAFANLEGTLYLLQDGRIYRQEGEMDEGEGVEWSVTFAPFAEMIHNKKGLSRLLLYLELDPGAWLEVDTAADQGGFTTVWTAKEGDGQALVVPIRPGRCNRFQVRLRGKGRFVLRSMVREFSVGGNWR